MNNLSVPHEFRDVATICTAQTISIGGKEILGISDARDLHHGLGVKRDYTTWIKARIAKYGFQEGCDYQVLLPKSGEQKGTGGGNAQTYRLTLDMAKELAMVENNPTGRLVRRYFIWLEQNIQNIRCEEGRYTAWLALPAEERRVRQRDVMLYGDAFGLTGMRWAMEQCGMPRPRVAGNPERHRYTSQQLQSMSIEDLARWSDTRAAK